MSETPKTVQKKRNMSVVINLLMNNKVSFSVGKADTTEHHRTAKENMEERNITCSSRNNAG